MAPEIVRIGRAELGLSPRALARRLGTSERTIYRWQDGSQGVPPAVAALLELLLWLRRVGIDDPFEV